MYDLLNMIEEEKENLPSGLYVNLLDELKKYYDESVYKKVLVKRYFLKPVNRKDDELFIMCFEEVLYDCKIVGINFNEFNIELEHEKEIIVHSCVLESFLRKQFQNDVEEFDDFQSEEILIYEPYIIRYTLTLV